MSCRASRGQGWGAVARLERALRAPVSAGKGDDAQGRGDTGPLVVPSLRCLDNRHGGGWPGRQEAQKPLAQGRGSPAQPPLSKGGCVFLLVSVGLSWAVPAPPRPPQPPSCRGSSPGGAGPLGRAGGSDIRSSAVSLPPGRLLRPQLGVLCFPPPGLPCGAPARPPHSLPRRPCDPRGAAVSYGTLPAETASVPAGGRGGLRGPANAAGGPVEPQALLGGASSQSKTLTPSCTRDPDFPLRCARRRGQRSPHHGE